MNLPSGMSTTPQGGSVYQQQVMAQQGAAGAGALLPTAISQGAAGAMDQSRLVQQQMGTVAHGASTAALNYGGPADADGRNALAAAQRLLHGYKAAIFQAGAVQPRGPGGALALSLLGQQIGQA